MRKTLEQIEAALKDGDLAFYSARCCWWTTDSKDLGSRDGSEDGLPCCPFCGSVLFEADARKFIADAKENPAHYAGGGDYEGGPAGSFVMSHHANGRHSAGDFSQLEPAQPNPRFARPRRQLSVEKSTRCVRCRSEFSEAETAGHRACLKCGSRGLPMAIAADVTVRVNWHELRILTMWAERWATVIEERAESPSESDAKDAVASIARALQSQHPTLPPLTLLGELQEIQEIYPEFEATDSAGNVILRGKKAN